MTDHLRAHDAALERLRGLHPIKIDLSLGRIERLLEALGRPQDRLPPTVHVAGTNGKGSTCAFLRAIGEAAGLRVHVLTSPHLVRFVERIRLAGTLIAEEALADVLARVEAANAGQPITFFEIVTAAAFVAFSEEPADLLVLEVGLGGRFDATNVIAAPAVSAITPVDYDHKEFLGEDLASIAGEKAGIVKAGRPVVSARQDEVAEAVIARQAQRLRAPIAFMGQGFDAWEEGGRMLYQGADRLLDLPLPSLYGAHQTANAGLAIAAALALNHPRIDDGAIARGVASAVWPARMQRLTAGPYGEMARTRGCDLWLDGGHNPHGARAVAATLAQLARDGRPVALVAGTLANKDAAGFFGAFAGLAPTVYATGFDA
ncbi:MAG: bifunctional folylpolyglutamate synthase/dihydrofolate synthase, partial [Caulobacteraceae bacterium]|nr:bifunctional folylpolyglutamate synthase/dihydrofolate synthase [Caulobacteraceae bacterium]